MLEKILKNLYFSKLSFKLLFKLKKNQKDIEKNYKAKILNLNISH